MLVAVQGCCHGSLASIYASIAQFEALKQTSVRLLLVCGDFQALRSEHDFASLAVPQKYQQLGTFHQYYSGEKTAPLLTIVIGGNHEASNYMWELFHGGWLAPNIYYLGTTGSIIVDGVRIVGSSGIYNEHSYGKGHFERVPYNGNQLRSVYHTRQYDIAKLMQLPPKPYTTFLSHDWPVSIPNHGDTQGLLARKPFFKSEVKSNSLGSPPLFNVMKHVQPEHWFAAHLHVKFAAVYNHSRDPKPGPIGPRATAAANPDEINVDVDDFDAVENGGNPDEINLDGISDDGMVEPSHLDPAGTVNGSENPDEIDIDDEFDEELEHHHHHHGDVHPDNVEAREPGNPDEINIEDEFDDGSSAPPPSNGISKATKEALKVDESVDLVEEARNTAGPDAVTGVIGSSAAQIGESSGASPGPGPTTTRNRRLSTSTSGESPSIPSLHPQTPTYPATKFLALDKPGFGRDFLQYLDIPTPTPIDPSLPPRMTFDPNWLAITRAFHPYLPTEYRATPLPRPEELDRLVRVEMERIEREGLLVPQEENQSSSEGGGVELIWDKGDIDVGRVQRFSPTAPAQGQPGGSSTAWYTNPQTEAFCGMLGLENKINPAPMAPSAPP